jgi:hypothetical protein
LVFQPIQVKQVCAAPKNVRIVQINIGQTDPIARLVRLARIAQIGQTGQLVTEQKQVMMHFVKQPNTYTPKHLNTYTPKHLNT